MGAASSQCHENSTCVCRPGFVGYKCDRCQDNFFLADGDTGCQECPTCYALVKEEVSCQAQTRPPSDQFHISIEHQPHAMAQRLPGHPQISSLCSHWPPSPEFTQPPHSNPPGPHLVLLSHPVLPSQRQGHTCPAQWGWDDRPDKESPPPLSKQRTTLEGLISNSTPK